MKRLTILFTRLPIKGETKSRLRDFLDLETIQNLTSYLIKKNLHVLKSSGYDYQIWYTYENAETDYKEYFESEGDVFARQPEGNLGDRMYQAMKSGFEAGYDQVLLVGSDLYNLSVSLVNDSFKALSDTDLVISPTLDGGYGLIAMDRPIYEVFDLPAYGDDLVFERLIKKAHQHDIQVQTLGSLLDIDTKEDIARALTGDPTARFLAQGEYNANFIFDNESKLLRIALGSQMHLPNQIDYEYYTLQQLEVSGAVPKVYELVPSTALIGLGYLVEEFLPGRPLEYEKDFKIAAELLARVHQVDPTGSDHLIKADQPFQVMYDEFIQMFSVYQKWTDRDLEIEKRIQTLLDRLQVFDFQAPLRSPCIINTELNSGNFLINSNGPSYIIDWEKPLLGEREQDLGHFLAPTTTLWKTDYIFNEDSLNEFVHTYDQYSSIPIDRKKLNQYLLFTCLRGLTWCSMAYVQYNQADKTLMNDGTYQVIKSYLSSDFIKMIEDYFEAHLS